MNVRRTVVLRRIMNRSKKWIFPSSRLQISSGVAASFVIRIRAFVILLHTAHGTLELGFIAGGFDGHSLGDEVRLAGLHR